jgi:hypothetical protein
MDALPPPRLSGFVSNQDNQTGHGRVRRRDACRHHSWAATKTALKAATAISIHGIERHSHICGDNGTSAEGTLVGTPNEPAMFNGVAVPVEARLKYFYDVWGTDRAYNHMAVPWAWAFDAPFPWAKQVASHLGGTRQGVAISWPKAIKNRGGLRHQDHHIIDVVPTVLEAAQVRQPELVDGTR